MGVVGGRTILFHVDVVGWCRRVAIRGNAVRAIFGSESLKEIEYESMLVEGDTAVGMVVDSHLQKPMGLSEDVDLETSLDGGLEGTFDFVVVSEVQHVVDMEDESDVGTVGIILNEVGSIVVRLLKVLGQEPFGKILVPPFARECTTVHAFAKHGGDSKKVGKVRKE